MMSTLLLFTGGICIGSFLNCVVYRLNRQQSPFKGRSLCPKCKHKLAWRDNFPLLSFIFLHGRCRYCRSPISWQYPLVELIAGILTVLVFRFFNFDLPTATYNLLISYILLAIFVSDLLYQTIPDQLVLPAVLISLLAVCSTPFALPSAFAAAGFFLLLVLITQGRGMGWGDVKLAGFMGLFLGWPKILIALFLAFLTGAISGVILILLKKKKFGQHISFGPFLTGATGISLFLGETIWQWYLKNIRV